MTHDEFIKILKRYKEGRGSFEDEILIEQWYNSINYEGNVKNILKNKEDITIKNRVWENIKKRISISYDNSENNKKEWKSYISPLYLGIAASVILLISVTAVIIWNASINSSNSNISTIASEESSMAVINSRNESKNIFLPDGSHIVLKKDSKISYSKLFDGSKREVILDGEAYFEVSKNPKRPFLVYTNEVITKVLGTSFVIKAFKADSEVTITVKSGKVTVYTKNDNKGVQSSAIETVLTPNQQIVYNRTNKTLDKKLVKTPEIIVSEEYLKRQHFENAPIIDIFSALEKIYQIKFNYNKSDFKDCRLTTSISDEGIFNRLDIICTAIGATYKVNGTTIEIEGKGCK